MTKDWSSQQLEYHVQKTLLVQIFKNFDAIRCSSLECLTDFLGRYLREIGVEAMLNADCAGRSKVNAIDVLSALQFLDSKLSTIFQYGNLVEEPFLTRLPKNFEIRKRPKISYSFKNMRAQSPLNVPNHFPIFPDEHTFKGTSSPSLVTSSQKFMVERNLDIKEKIENNHVFHVVDGGVRLRPGNESRKQRDESMTFEFYCSYLCLNPDCDLTSSLKSKYGKVEAGRLGKLIAGKIPFNEVASTEEIT